MRETGGEFGADIVRGVEDAALVKVAGAKEYELYISGGFVRKSFGYIRGGGVPDEARSAARGSQHRYLGLLRTAISVRWRCDGYGIWEVALLRRHQSGKRHGDGGAIRLTGAVVGTAAIAFRADAIGGGVVARGRMMGSGDGVGELFQGYRE